MTPYELRWKSVSNHQRNRLLPRRQVECVIAREPLKKCRLPHCNGAILLWMKEAPLRRIKTSARYGGRYFVPRHPSINVFETVTPFMAFQLAALWQITPASAIFGNISYQLSN